MSVTLYAPHFFYEPLGGCRGRWVSNSPNRFWPSAPAGFWGKGLGASQLKLLSLPILIRLHLSRDRRGAWLCGALGVVVVFVFWGVRGWQVASAHPDLFGQLLAAGSPAGYCFSHHQMGVSCGLLPTKGFRCRLFRWRIIASSSPWRP